MASEMENCREFVDLAPLTLPNEMWAKEEQMRKMKMDFLLWDFHICVAGVLNELREKPSSMTTKEHKRPKNWQVRGDKTSPKAEGTCPKEMANQKGKSRKTPMSRPKQRAFRYQELDPPSIPRSEDKEQEEPSPIRCGTKFGSGGCQETGGNQAAEG
ncbi:hypothetical protein R1flu_008005 [Riccia fluitans]|uniref:Uncharacterized protein n=1 Tax=Riccia fluitans TaxID=41844 RepID=A0ABD1YAN7_9MARC